MTRAKTIQKVKPNKYIAAGLLLFFAVMGTLYILLSSAATPGTPAFGLYLSPSSGTPAVGSQLNVSIYGNLGSNSVQSMVAYLRYDSTKLQLTSANQSGVDPDYTVTARCTAIDGCKPAGEIAFVAGYSGTGAIAAADGLLIGNLSFKVLASGNTALTLDPDPKLSGFSSPSIPQATLDNRTLLNGSYVVPGSTPPANAGGGTTTPNNNSPATTKPGTSTTTTTKKNTGSGTATTPGAGTETTTTTPSTEQPTTTTTTPTQSRNTGNSSGTSDSEGGEVAGEKTVSTPMLLVISGTLAAVIVGTTMLAFSGPVRAAVKGTVLGASHLLHHNHPIAAGHVPTGPVHVVDNVSHIEPPHQNNTVPSAGESVGNIVKPNEPPTPPAGQ